MNNRTVKFRWFMWEGVAISSWFMWIVSSFLSYWGLTHLAPNLPTWMKDIAIGFSIVINFVEFMIDQKGWRALLHPETFGDVVLRLFGLGCYGYDILTNVEGFIAIVFAAFGVTQISQAWAIDPTLTIMAITFGFCFAAGPEPVYLEYLQNRFPYPGITPWSHLWKGFTGNYTPSYKQPSKVDQYRKPVQNPPSGLTFNTPQEYLDYLRKKHPDQFRDHQ